MAAIFLAATLIATSLMTTSMAFPDRMPNFFECTQDSECGQGQCCVIGMNRYSVPSCRSYGQSADVCIRGSEPRNMTLRFPNDIEVKVVGVHVLFCPCARGWTCDRSQCVQETNTNYIRRQWKGV